MHALPISLAAAAAGAAFLPGSWWLASLGLAIVAIAAGWTRFRDRRGHGFGRLLAAAASFVGGAVLLAGAAKVALTLVAIRSLAAAL